MEQETPSPGLGERLVNKVRTSATVRLFLIGILVLILLIPSGMIQSLVYERQSTHDEAINEISNKWGLEQRITGPVLMVPFTVTRKDANGQLYTETDYSYYLPDEIEVGGDMKSEKRHRGIYEAVLYQSKMHVKGNFGPQFTNVLPALPATANMQEAKLIVGISDVRGIRNKVTMKWDSLEIVAQPGGNLNLLGSGISFPLNKIDFTKGGAFEFDLELAGSQAMFFTPVGKNTIVNLKSDWPSPSFDGAFLPVHEDKPTGFTAQWRVLELNRSFLQHWEGENPNLSASDFGVKMWIAADEYQKTHRSVRYCVLFISLTFIFFFIIELRSGIPVHPVQYLLIGLAISIFYLLLLSLSEWLGFDKAYFISAAAVTGLIALFSISVLRNKFYSAVAALVQVLLYIFLYTTLRLEDLSLLIGSIGLFLTLAVLMYFSRGLNKDETTPKA